MIKMNGANEFIMDGQMLAKNAIKKMQKNMTEKAEKMFPDGVQDSFIPEDKFMFNSPEILRTISVNKRKEMDVAGMVDTAPIASAMVAKRIPIADARVGQKLDIVVDDGHFFG